MKWTFAILVLASAVTLSSTSASAYSYRHHYRNYRGFYNSMNMMPVYGPGYWYGYSSLPGGGMLDRSAAVNGSPAGGTGAAGGP